MFVMRKVLPFYSFTGKRCVLASALNARAVLNFSDLVLLARSVVTPWRLSVARVSSTEAFCLAL